MFSYNRITRSLCAVLLCVSLLLGQQSILAAPGDGAGLQPLDDGYVYAIDIEFGNFAFYYDYGVWNVNTMRYEASQTSTEPAVGTVNGFPGWYGFDSTSNLIQITNRSTSKSAVEFSLNYRSLNAGELTAAGVDQIVTDVTMVVTDSAGNPLLTTRVAADEDTPVQWFIHLQGEPHVGGQVYDSNTMNPIGMLTIKIEDWDGKS